MAATKAGLLRPGPCSDCPVFAGLAELAVPQKAIRALDNARVPYAFMTNGGAATEGLLRNSTETDTSKASESMKADSHESSCKT